MALFVVTAVTIIAHRQTWPALSSRSLCPRACRRRCLPLLVPIEILSYLIRPISLSVRLFVNMMAGHIMLKTFAGFIIALSGFFVIPAIAPLGADRCALRSRARDRLPAGLCVHGPELHPICRRPCTFTEIRMAGRLRSLRRRCADDHPIANLSQFTTTGANPWKSKQPR